MTEPTWASDCGTVRLWLGDCLEVMQTWPDGAVDCVVTDPPYGCNKASWDRGFPDEWYMNGMTRGPMGFGNWLSCVVAKRKPRMGANAFDFAVGGDMPEHPSPKPIEYMIKLVSRLTEPSQTIADPFMGSGTTGVAAVRLGRQFWGVEIDPQYFETAKRRIRDELRRAAFLEGNSDNAPKQLSLLEE